MILLSQAALGDLPVSVRCPHYSRTALRPGIVHIGLGNFQRAHQAWYLQQLLNMGLNHDWAIVGAGVRPYDAEQREKFLKQDFLSTLIELSPNGKKAEVIGSMIDYIPVEDGHSALIRGMATESTRIVTLTVTEGGYYVDPSTGDFDLSHPDIQHDIVNANHPTTAFGAIVAALKRRRDRGFGPFTCQSCDNLQGNGKILRRNVVTLARETDLELADWIEINCTFPCSMVDCIVPATGPAELALSQKFGICDLVPVTHENFRQWVVEDEFCAGRPDWNEVGVTFTDSVQDYEAMKIRMLNAGHQIVANPGELLSIDTIAECMTHPLIFAMFQKVQREEVIPHVKPVPDVTPEQYLQLIVQRLSNSALGDTTRRVCFNGSSLHAGFILPTVRKGLYSGTPTNGLALVEAMWARMCEGTREDGSTIEPNDPLSSELQGVAQMAREHPKAWLEQRGIYGDIADATEFVKNFETWLDRIWAVGCESVLKEYTAT
ncbi:MAG: mannitol dehydrogenase family protein [Acidiferrobacterales bacterium]|nr:mannitol dehydrogenase family protein [Acidiferrobacterales bacterium]